MKSPRPWTYGEPVDLQVLKAACIDVIADGKPLKKALPKMSTSEMARRLNAAHPLRLEFTVNKRLGWGMDAKQGEGGTWHVA